MLCQVCCSIKQGHQSPRHSDNGGQTVYKIYLHCGILSDSSWNHKRIVIKPFASTFLKIFSKEYHQSVKQFVSRSEPTAFFFGLILVQTFCIRYQPTTQVVKEFNWLKWHNKIYIYILWFHKQIVRE